MDLHVLARLLGFLRFWGIFCDFLRFLEAWYWRPDKNQGQNMPHPQSGQNTGRQAEILSGHGRPKSKISVPGIDRHCRGSWWNIRNLWIQCRLIAVHV